MNRVDDAYTPDEANALLSQLTVAEYRTLQKKASFLAGTLPGADPKDLFSEAIEKILEPDVESPLRRNWPRGIPSTTFIGNVMRSLLSNERKKRRREKSLEDLTETSGLIVPVNNTTGLDEQCEEWDLRLGQLERRLAADQEAMAIYAGIRKEMKRKEIMARFKLDAKTFNAARARLMRHAEAVNKEVICDER